MKMIKITALLTLMGCGCQGNNEQAAILNDPVSENKDKCVEMANFKDRRGYIMKCVFENDVCFVTLSAVRSSLTVKSKGISCRRKLLTE